MFLILLTAAMTKRHPGNERFDVRALASPGSRDDTGDHISVNENWRLVGVGCHTAQYSTYRLPPPMLTTCSLVGEAFQGCRRPASEADHLLQHPGGVDLGPSTPGRGLVSSFVCLDETINKS